MAAYIKSDNHITVTLDDGNTFTVYSNTKSYDKVVDAVKAGDFETAYKYSNPMNLINATMKGNVEVVNGVVFYKDEEVHNSLTVRLIQMIEEGFDPTPMMLFLDNLMENPSSSSVQELYGFLEYGQLPITEDGYFLAYKRVDDNYKDCHTHTIDNSVGAVVEMPRNKVDDNKNNTCSHGLHFASREYVQGFYGSHMMVLKIHPKDVVSIPVDYNNTKGRCCKYEVIAEIEQDARIEGLVSDTSQYDFADGEDVCDDCENIMDECECMEFDVEVCDDCGEMEDDCECQEATPTSINFPTREKARDFCRDNPDYKFSDDGHCVKRWNAVLRNS